MQEAIEAIQATVELAAREGATQARIQLHPAELGEIRIHLTQTATGLFARITAGSAAAIGALAAGHGELHQSLSSLGIDLARLHVGSHGDASTGAAGAGVGDGRAQSQQTASQPWHAQQRSGRLEDEHDSIPDSSAAEALAEPTSAEHAAYAPGALLDVLA